MARRAHSTKHRLCAVRHEACFPPSLFTRCRARRHRGSRLAGRGIVEDDSTTEMRSETTTARSRGGPLRRMLMVLGLLVAILAGSAEPGLAKCEDSAAVQKARLRIADACDCRGLPTHRVYKTCARAVVRQLVDRGELPEGCRARVMRCESKSVCGSQDAVTCLSLDGAAVSCRVAASATACGVSGDGGSCVVNARDCCEARRLGACPTPAPPPPACGSSEFPSCGGECPTGEVCQAYKLSGDQSGAYCACTEPMNACCGPVNGACAPGQVCSIHFVGASAECGCTTAGLTAP
ncbi:MAG: hypothetical protein RL698_1790 [Pseudomonadota bacterium]